MIDATTYTKVTSCCLSLSLAALFAATFCQASDDPQVPSVEFLEFLIEFSETDDETFTMLVENGLRDVQKNDPQQTEADQTPNKHKAATMGDNHEDS